MKRPSLIIVLCFICGTVTTSFYAKECQPLIWNMENLKRIKADSESYNRTIRKIIEISNQYSTSRPISVTDKKRTFAPDKHIYCSIGSYYWPDPVNPGGAYITKDGQINPEYYEYDVERLAEMTRRCLYLSLAYFFTENAIYYDSYINQIKTWFLDEDTYMEPNFDYAGIAPGQNNNKGRCSGIIQTYVFNNLIESVRLMVSMGEIDTDTYLSLQAWFRSFAYWAENNRYSQTLVRDVKNNIGLAYDVLLVNIYLFVGNEKRAKEIADRFGKVRINVQINELGMQPEELKRTKAFSYSIYNLTHILDFFFLTRYWNDSYFEEQKNRITMAFSFLNQYVDKEHTFPYQQITKWDKCVNDFKLQFNRLKRLQGNKSFFPQEKNPISIYTLIQ